jgi:predicted anti-sigma-YlaC factor YlaD
MKCEELITYLSDYIDQNLSDELRADAQEHLSTCQNCRVVLDTTQKMIFLYRQNGKQGIPAGRRKDLFLRLQQQLDRFNR